MAKTDKTIEMVCVDCGNTFEISAGEQEWYHAQGFQMPKRCSECRKNKRIKNKRKDK